MILLITLSYIEQVQQGPEVLWQRLRLRGYWLTMPGTFTSGAVNASEVSCIALHKEREHTCGNMTHAFVLCCMEIYTYTYTCTHAHAYSHKRTHRHTITFTAQQWSSTHLEARPVIPDSPVPLVEALPAVLQRHQTSLEVEVILTHTHTYIKDTNGEKAGIRHHFHHHHTVMNHHCHLVQRTYQQFKYS